MAHRQAGVLCCDWVMTGGGGSMSPVRSAELAVGDPRRVRAGLEVAASLGLAAVFTGVTWVCKEAPALNLRQPWRDDPYDVLVSLDFAVLPVLVAVGALRVQLCRRSEPLPARRLLDLLRVSSAALGVCLATDEWVAVLLGRHRASWTGATTWQVAVLAVLTVATVGAWARVRSATRTVAGAGRLAAQPDWLSDGVALGLRVAGVLGLGAPARAKLCWVDAQVITRVRTHPVAAAGILAGGLAAPFVAAKIVLEGFEAPLVLLAAAFVTAALFAVVVVVGAYLRVVAPRSTPTPVWLSSTVLACAAGSVAFAFHDSLLAHQTVGGLSALFFGGGVAAGTASFAAQTLWRQIGPCTPG